MKTVRILAMLLLVIGMSACAKKEEDLIETSGLNEPIPSEIVHAELSIENYGVIKLELYPEVAPQTVENFVKLANDGFYDGNRFHRIIDGFMIQGGKDLYGTVGKIKGEFDSNGFENELKHTKGVISMARATDPDSASSQFFIMVGDAEWLDGEYAAFGKVTEGYEVAEKIAKDARPIDNNGTIAEEEQPVIEYIRITE
ncbi:MAG: peptidylprolyl isomerase [Erysipelotrichaceae bacterium]|nr:peptidylprolyl isomerase [Erysipelotrichaceae bacterium]